MSHTLHSVVEIPLFRSSNVTLTEHFKLGRNVVRFIIGHHATVVWCHMLHRVRIEDIFVPKLRFTVGPSFSGVCICHRLCVVLLTKKIAEHDSYRSTFRDFAIENSDRSDRVRFAYVYEDTQSPFVKSVTWGRGAVNDTLGSLKVAAFWNSTEKNLLQKCLVDWFGIELLELMMSDSSMCMLWVLTN